MKIRSAIGCAALLAALSMPGLAQAGFSPFNWMDDARDNFDNNRGDYGRYENGRYENGQYGNDRYSDDRYGRSAGRSDGYASPYSGRDSYDRGYGRDRWNGYDQLQPNYWRYRYFDRSSPDYLPDQFGGDRFSGNPNRNRDYSRDQRQYKQPYSNQNRYTGQRRGYRSDYEGSADRTGSDSGKSAENRGSTSSQNRP